MDKRIFEIGIPGKFDPVFAIEKMELRLDDETCYVYRLILKDTGECIHKGWWFTNPLSAENWIYINRKQIIEEHIEKMMLG